MRPLSSIERACAFVKKLLKDRDPKTPAFDETLRDTVRNDFGQLLFPVTKRRQVVVPVVIEVWDEMKKRRLPEASFFQTGKSAVARKASMNNVFCDVGEVRAGKSNAHSCT